MKKTFIKHKIPLIFFGIFLSIILLEASLHLGGYVFLYFQEYNNRKAIEQKDAYRILCLGESTTAAGDVNPYPSQLEKILNHKNIGIKFSVINKGMAGITTAHILENLESNLDRYKPNMVIAMMGINDGTDYILYEDIHAMKSMLFLKSFRCYKLFKLL